MRGDREVGIRVGAIWHSDKDTIYLFGYGVYEGREVPPEYVKFLGVPFNAPNPQIKLDNGKLVFGCECWWAPEEEVKHNVAKFKNVILVDIEEARAKRESQ